jgi:two-component system, cell cycle sensor histidine kinase and response regulator CckA
MRRKCRLSGHRVNSDGTSEGTRVRSISGAIANAGLSAAGGLIVAGSTAMPALAQGTADSPGQLVLLQVLVVIFALTAAGAILWGISCRRRGRFLDRLFESLPGPRLVVNPDGKTVVATSSWIRLLGETDAPIDTLASLAARDGADGKARFDALLDSVSKGQPARADFRLDLPDMEFVEVSAVPPGEASDSVFWRLEDVSERYELERVIRTEQEKLIEFVENAPIGFYSVDGEGRFRYVNATFAEWLGRTEAELINGHVRLRDFLPDRLVKTCEPHSPLAGETGDCVGDTAFAGRDGEIFNAYVTQTVIVNELNGDLRTRTLVRHLSGERHFAEAVRVSQERFQRFFFDAPVGIVLLDADACITECNQAFATATGLESERAVGLSFADVVIEEDRDKFSDWVVSAYDNDDPPTPIEVRLDGTRGVTVSLYAGRAENAPENGENGENGVEETPSVNLIIHVTDLSEQKRIEAQFFQSQKMELVGQLAGGIAHDFNNLLTAMIGFCDLLLLRHTPRDQSFADIQQIKQNANRAANLVRQLLAFSRQQTLQPKVLDMTDVLSETSYLLRRLIGADIELKFYHGRDLWLMKADQGQFEQVVINLAVNARDAMEGGGSLTIRTSNVYAGDPRLRDYKGIPDADYVLLEMQDNGTGIPDEVIDKIFEPFFTTKEVGAGTGLGLSTVYGIVKQTGGYVFADNVAGMGARFSVYLPRFQEEETDEEPAPPAEQEERRDLTGVGTVMLVEDEDAVRLFGARALRNKGYSVVEAKDGESALEVLNGVVDGMATTVDGEKIDLLITDVVMPGVDGPTLVREVRERYPELKVIFISGYTEDTFRDKLGAGEEVEFLSKPFTLQQLAGKVKEVLEGARKGRG